MIRDTSLREVIGTDLLGTVSGTDLAAAFCCLCILLFLQLQIIQLGTKEAEGLLFVLQLRFLSLAVDHDAGRHMGQADCGIGGVDTLSAVTGRTHDIDTAVIHIDLDIYILSLRHNCNGCRGGVDTSAGLRLRHTLHAMYTGLVLHLGISTFSGDHSLHLFESTDSILIEGNNFNLPVLALCIVYVHAVKLRRKQSGLITARTGTDLQHDVLVIIRIFREQQDL